MFVSEQIGSSGQRDDVRLQPGREGPRATVDLVLSIGGGATQLLQVRKGASGLWHHCPGDKVVATRAVVFRMLRARNRRRVARHG